MQTELTWGSFVGGREGREERERGHRVTCWGDKEREKERRERQRCRERKK